MGNIEFDEVLKVIDETIKEMNAELMAFAKKLKDDTEKRAALFDKEREEKMADFSRRYDDDKKWCNK